MSIEKWIEENRGASLQTVLMDGELFEHFEQCADGEYVRVSDLRELLKDKVVVPVQECINKNLGCNNDGCYPVQVGVNDCEPCQCEFCYTVPNSRFNVERLLSEGEA